MSESDKVFDAAIVNAVGEAFIEHMGFSPGGLDLDTNLRTLNLDSLDVVEICIIIEGKLHRDIEPPKDLRTVVTLRDLLKLVEKYERHNTDTSPQTI